MSVGQLAIQTVTFIAVLIVYTVLTLTGHDANFVAGILGGQGLAGGVSLATKQLAPTLTK